MTARKQKINTSWCIDAVQNEETTTVYILDELTQWVWGCMIPNSDFAPIHVSALVYCLGYFGQPEVIYFDNSPLLQQLKKSLKEYTIKLRPISDAPQKKGKLERAIRMLHNRPKPVKMPRKATIKVDNKDEAQDPFRAAILNLHMQIQADLENRVNHGQHDGQSCYAASLLNRIEEMCRAIDPELFKEESWD